jgi:hypothetical protein
MKRIILGALLVLLTIGPAVADSRKDRATAKKLAGAALTSFMTKCQKDANASCDAAAKSKKLSGAAKTTSQTSVFARRLGRRSDTSG